MLARFLRRFEAPPAWRPDRGVDGAPQQDYLAIRWLGTAGHSLRRGGRTLLLDPFVSRPGISRLFRRLRPDGAAIARWAPEADAIVCGHAHFDHLLDAPEIAARTGAVLAGSESVARVARARGIDESRLRVAPEGGRAFDLEPFHVELRKSLHARLVLGLAPPLPGRIERASPRGLFFHQYRADRPYGVHVRAGDVSVYHNGSADLIDAELEGLEANVLLVGIAGYRWTADYLARLVRILRPRVVVPTHYDWFFAPLEDGVRLLPGVSVERFAEEIGRLAPDVRVVVPSPWEELRVSDGGRRLAVVPL